MKTTKKSLYALMIIAAALIGIQHSNAQDNPKLTIGDEAPEFKYSKVLKGDKISMEADQLYVFEFWATWCVPCRAIMPHITKLQQEYKDKVRFVGVDVWEKVPEGQTYESYIPTVAKFVKSNSANMGYTVVADNNDQQMGTKWLRAAGENGIPTSFIVKNKKIYWIGHPSQLDSILPLIIEGKYDVTAMRNKRERANSNQAKEMAAMQAAFAPITEAVKNKEYAKAIELMDKTEAAEPKYKGQINYMRLSALMDFDENKAIEFVKTWQKERPGVASSSLGEVYKRDGLKSSTYIWFAKNYEDSKIGSNAVILNAVAVCYAKGGDYASAVTWQEKAVEAAKVAVKENSLPGYVRAETVTEYENLLAEYKKKKG